jgi:hypothetical protein
VVSVSIVGFVEGAGPGHTGLPGIGSLRILSALTFLKRIKVKYLFTSPTFDPENALIWDESVKWEVIRIYN